MSMSQLPDDNLFEKIKWRYLVIVAALVLIILPIKFLVEDLKDRAKAR